MGSQGYVIHMERFGQIKNLENTLHSMGWMRDWNSEASKKLFFKISLIYALQENSVSY